MDDGTVQGLIGAIYDAAYDRSRWHGYLTALRDATDAASTNMIVIDHAAGGAQIVAELTGSSAHHRVYQEHYWRCDEFSRAYRESGIGPGRAWSSAAVIPDRRMLTGEFYNDFLRSLDLFYFAGGILYDRDQVQVSSGIMRAHRQGPAESADLRAFDILIPHLQRAVLIDRRLRELELRAQAADAVADDVPFGIVLLNAAGKVLQMNRCAVGILERQDGLRIADGRLVAMRPADDRPLQAVIAGCLAAAPSAEVLAVGRPSGLRPLHVVAASGPRDGPVVGFAALAPAAVLFVSDPERRAQPLPARLRQAFGLTRREAELAALLAQGRTLGEAAEALAFARGTAGIHLKRIFRKTGSHRQSQLVALLLSLPAVGIPDSRRP